MRYVIVGSGVAAFAAVEAIRSLDRQGEIILVSADPHGYYSRPGLAYYLSGEIPEQMLYLRRPQEWGAWGVRFLIGQVQRVDLEGRQVEVLPQPAARRSAAGKGGEPRLQLGYDRLLLAVGAQAVPLKVPGADLPQVVKLDNLEEARYLLQLARRSRRAVVIGGGITALELVEGLLAQRVQVHYLLRGDRYWSSVLDEAEARIVESHLRQQGVRLHYHAEVEEILGKQNQVRGVRLTSGEVLPCELVAYAIGVQPRLELARQAGLAVERGILVDATLQTSQPGVYAAGDVAQVFDPRVGRAVLDSLWTPARQQGYTAGLNMAGAGQAYQRSVAFNVTRLVGITTTIIGGVGQGRDADTVGIVRGDSETWRELPEAIVAQSGFEVNRLRLMVGERHISGAVVMGNQALSIPLQHMIAQQVDISAIRPALLAPSPALADLLTEFWGRQR